MNNIPMMPLEYRGKEKTGCGFTFTTPREWNSQEVAWLKSMHGDGYSIKEIAKSMGRTEASVSLKLKRMTKVKRTYNAKHIEEKYAINSLFLEQIQPRTVLDLYCGSEHFYNGKVEKVVTNDIDKSIDADFNCNALNLICYLYAQDRKYDLIDLDPFGSAYDCFDLAVKMATKGLAITLGELGHKRFKRVDYVKTHYGIESLDDFTIQNMISHIQTIGARNKKKLTVFDYREWQNIGRVWFLIEPLKVMEQWENMTDESYEEKKNKHSLDGQMSLFDLYGDYK